MADALAPSARTRNGKRSSEAALVVGCRFRQDFRRASARRASSTTSNGPVAPPPPLPITVTCVITGVIGATVCVMVSTAVAGEPKVALPVGLLNVRLTVSLPATVLLTLTGTLTVLAAVSPAAKLTV